MTGESISVVGNMCRTLARSCGRERCGGRCAASRNRRAARLSRRAGVGCYHAGWQGRTIHPGDDIGAHRSRVAARSDRDSGPAHRGVRGRRRHRSRAPHRADRATLHHGRGPDRTLARHHAGTRRHRHYDPRRHRAAPAGAARRGRRGQEERPRDRRHLDTRRSARRDRRSLLADMGHRREPVRLGAAFRGQGCRCLAQGHLASHHVQPQPHRRGPCPFHAQQGRALQGVPDPRQRHRHPDHRQPVRAQPGAQPPVQGRRPGRSDQ